MDAPTTTVMDVGGTLMRAFRQIIPRRGISSPWARNLAKALATAGAVGGLLLTTAPQSAAAVAYRNWTQAPNNAAGVVFEPCGDVWKLWDNVRDGKVATAVFNYKGVSDHWKAAIQVQDGYATAQRNVYEKYHIYFKVITRYGNSPIVEYKTNGGC